MTIKANNFVHTPKDWDEIQKYVESALQREDRVVGYVVASMAWNLAASLTNDPVSMEGLKNET